MVLVVLVSFGLIVTVICNILTIICFVVVIVDEVGSGVTSDIVNDVDVGDGVTGAGVVGEDVIGDIMVDDVVLVGDNDVAVVCLCVCL